jgi:hypothetical protein
MDNHFLKNKIKETNNSKIKKKNKYKKKLKSLIIFKDGSLPNFFNPINRYIVFIYLFVYIFFEFFYSTINLY